jgi:uncharacterized protein
MNRRFLARATGGLFLGSAAIRSASAAAPRHRVALHVASGDSATMEMALHHISNVIEVYAATHEMPAFELVALGPGYAMLRADKSPVAEQIAALHAQYPAIRFSSCQNSRRGAAQREGKAITEIPELSVAVPVPAGIARLVALQESGWSYIRV